MDELMPFFIGMGVIFAGVVVFAYVVKMLEVRRARDWKTTQGRIVQSKIKAHRRKDIEGKSIHENVPDIVYEYEVGGKRYTAARLSFAERITGVDAEDALKRYPAGKVVQVSYNPQKPGEAVLERALPKAVGKGVSWLVVFFIGAGLLIPLSFSGAASWLEPWLPNPERSSLVAYLIGLALFTLLLAFVMQREVWAAGQWSATQGKVISSESEEYRSWSTTSSFDTIRTFYRPLIVYAYMVDGREYVSDRVTFGGYAGWSASLFFRRSLEKYPVDREVAVYYDPNNPSAAVLERRVWGLPLLLGVAVVLIGLAVSLSGFSLISS